MASAKTESQEKAIAVTLDEKNRITVPYLLRKELDLKPGDTLVLRVADGRIEAAKIPDPFVGETKDWLEADLEPPMEPYDWGPAGPPAGEPIQYDPEMGFYVEKKD